MCRFVNRQNSDLHWSDLDKCDALASGSDSESDVEVEKQDNSWMRDSDDCSSDGND